MKMMLQTGDTLISSKRLLEAALVLSSRPPESLLDLLTEDESLRVSLAFLIESVVLHEKLLCISSEEIFRTLVLQSSLAKLLTLLRPIPHQSLVSELEAEGHVDVPNIKLGFARASASPTLVLSPKHLASFNQAFPDLAAENASKVTIDTTRPTRREIDRRHFSYYETVASLALGAAHSLSGHELKSGYKLYQERVLEEVKNVAEERASQLNAWLRRNHFSVQTPLVFSYVLKRAASKQELLSVALDLRESREATAFRKQCILFDQALKDGDDKALVGMFEEIQDKIFKLAKRITSPPMKLDFSFPPSVTISPIEIWDSIKTKRKRHLIFISYMYEAALLSGDVNERFGKLFRS